MGGQAKRDYSKFDLMSTDKLEALLRLYIDLPDDADVDIDAVNYIAGVVARRDKEMYPEKYPSKEEAWQDFLDNYCPTDEELAKLEENESKVPSIAATQKTAPAQTSRRRWHSMSMLSRVASIALVLILVGFAGMGVAQASGVDVFGAVATWTDEIFMFRGPGGNLMAVSDGSSQDSLTYTSLQDALDSCGIDLPLAPTWIPKGYSFTEVTADKLGADWFIVALYDTPDGKNITVAISAIASGSPDALGTIEIDNGSVSEYERGGIIHCISQNIGDVQAYWLNENCECFISGNGLSVKELKIIINSIYQE